MEEISSADLHKAMMEDTFVDEMMEDTFVDERILEMEKREFVIAYVLALTGTDFAMSPRMKVRDALTTWETINKNLPSKV